MRAKEFIINVPINVRINGSGDPEFGDFKPKDDDKDAKQDYAIEKSKLAGVMKVNNTLPPKDPSELDPDPLMVPPLQQQIEINKAAVGKVSPVIDDLTQDEEDPDDETAV